MTLDQRVICECGGKVSYPHIKYCNNCIDEMAKLVKRGHCEKELIVLRNKIFRTLPNVYYRHRVRSYICAECKHLSWTKGYDGCFCLCHTRAGQYTIKPNFAKFYKERPGVYDKFNRCTRCNRWLSKKYDRCPSCNQKTRKGARK